MNMKHSSRVDIVRPLPSSPAKAAKGWIKINLSDRELKEMRQLARACGVAFNLVLRGALSDAKEKLKLEAVLALRSGLALDQRRKVFQYSGKVERN